MSSIFDEEYFIPELSRYSFNFPDPNQAASEGLLAFGGGLEPNRILTAYRKGIFPWFNEDDPILWWSPDPRLLLYPENFKVRKSFRKVLRNRPFIVKFDHDFEQVIKMCAKIREAEGTWLIEEMQKAYTELYHMGFAHSVAVYLEGEFIGGLYGLAMGRAFFGESMVSLKPDASKIALKALSDVLEKKNYKFIDCQVPTPHLQSLGATLVERSEFLKELDEALLDGGDIGSWSHYRWEYNDG